MKKEIHYYINSCKIGGLFTILFLFIFSNFLPAQWVETGGPGSPVISLLVRGNRSLCRNQYCQRTRWCLCFINIQSHCLDSGQFRSCESLCLKNRCIQFGPFCRDISFWSGIPLCRRIMGHSRNGK